MELIFKVGDTVRRVRGSHAGMKIGDTATIEDIKSTGNLVLKEYQYNSGCPGSHDVEYFELVVPAVLSAPMHLSTDANTRKATPITTGVLDYFPRALAAVAQCSKAGNDQHHPGQPLYWEKDKSADHADCIARHLIDRHTVDTDGIMHAAKLAWRALALLEIALEEQETK